MNLLLANGRYIHQWETPINEWIVLAYGRDQIEQKLLRAYDEPRHPVSHDTMEALSLHAGLCMS
jgi:hypothetical protein